MDFWGELRHSIPKGYQFDTSWNTKADAQKRARKLRRNLYYAQVIKKKTKHGNYIVVKKVKV